jgi:hypothetical protein
VIFCSFVLFKVKWPTYEMRIVQSNHILYFMPTFRGTNLCICHTLSWTHFHCMVVYKCNKVYLYLRPTPCWLFWQRKSFNAHAQIYRRLSDGDVQKFVDTVKLSDRATFGSEKKLLHAFSISYYFFKILNVIYDNY